MELESLRNFSEKNKEHGLFSFQFGLIQNCVEHILELCNILTTDRHN